MSGFAIRQAKNGRFFLVCQATDGRYEVEVKKLPSEVIDVKPNLEQRVEGDCCMARHANAVPPWTCDCSCHSEAE